MANKGIDALSVKDVARKAKVSRGVAYQHFADRDALMREARRSVSYRLMEAAIDMQPASLEERIRQVVDLVSSNTEASRMLIEDALAGENLGRTIRFSGCRYRCSRTSRRAATRAPTSMWK